MSKKKKLTPLMRQYFDIKDQYPGTILLFRVGDFYETFAEDAVRISKELGITLTTRSPTKPPSAHDDENKNPISSQDANLLYEEYAYNQIYIDFLIDQR